MPPRPLHHLSDLLEVIRIVEFLAGVKVTAEGLENIPTDRGSVFIGNQVLFIATFPPRKMMGIESQGMILSAVDADGKLVVTTVSAPVKNGCQVG